MSGHAHRCPLCSTVKMCLLAECTVPSGARAQCRECTEALEHVDDLPAPTRPPLTIETMVLVVAAGARAALEQRARNPERCLGALLLHVERLSPVDGTRGDIDTWARLGAVAGARDAWMVARSPKTPVDCPVGGPAAAYVIMYTGAALVVGQSCSEVKS